MVYGLRKRLREQRNARPFDRKDSIAKKYTKQGAEIGIESALFPVKIRGADRQDIAIAVRAKICQRPGVQPQSVLTNMHFQRNLRNMINPQEDCGQHQNARQRTVPVSFPSLVHHILHAQFSHFHFLNNPSTPFLIHSSATDQARLASNSATKMAPA